MYRSVAVRHIPVKSDETREMAVVAFINAEYAQGWEFVSQLTVAESNGIGGYPPSSFLLFKARNNTIQRT